MIQKDKNASIHKIFRYLMFFNKILYNWTNFQDK